jgi:hypothetical protein
MNFINNDSFKCLLGQRSKNITVINNIFFWEVNNRKHFTVSGILNQSDLDILQSRNFHYLSKENIKILKSQFKLETHREDSVILDIQDLTFTGNKGKNIRYCLNRNKNNNFSLEPNYRKISDVEELIEEWSSNYCDKYFRDNSGKNFYFYKNNFHKGLTSLFVYDKQKLISFGTLSSPVNNSSSYILGKALYKRFYGLSEFADVELYKLAQKQKVSHINMGAACDKGLKKYKCKFDHILEDHFDGKVISVKKA